MTVYIDNARIPYRRMLMSHMIADSEEELHNMAKAINMRREWFQPLSFPHYDVSVEKRKHAIKLGAIPVSRRELVKHIKRIRHD